jgi:pimeloyl-ACP methyl ester carboxylesterase
MRARRIAIRVLRVLGLFYALARKEAGKLPLALFGRSIGTGLAVRLAARNPVTALVLETPYTSLRDVARKFYPWAPTFLLRYPLESTRWIVEVRAPVLILHGDADELIPYGEGRELASLQPRARLVTIPHGRHNDLREFPLFWHELTSFFRRFGEN